MGDSDLKLIALEKKWVWDFVWKGIIHRPQFNVAFNI
jgi:hypothetical protein